MATQQEVADHLDVSDRTVRELIEKSILPDAGRGMLDLDACRVAYLRHLREIAAGRGGAAEQESLSTERARLAAEQREHYALRNAAARRELLPRTAVTLAVTGTFQRVRDKLMLLPDRMAGPLARLADPAVVRQRLADAIGGALAELAETAVIAAAEREAPDV